MSAAIPANGFDPQNFMSYVRRVGHGGALSIDYVAHGADWAELSLPYDDKLVGMPETGVIASGPIISLMDMATSVAIWCRLDRFRHQATLDGECYGVTRSIAFVRGTAHDGDSADPVAHVTGTFMFTD
jgi:acyl-coenzyme A thioesterase PaaI-like protein